MGSAWSVPDCHTVTTVARDIPSAARHQRQRSRAKLRDNGAVFQCGAHRAALKALVESKELVYQPGARNAKCYRINIPNTPASPDSPQIAHG